MPDELEIEETPDTPDDEELILPDDTSEGSDTANQDKFTQLQARLEQQNKLMEDLARRPVEVKVEAPAPVVPVSGANEDQIKALEKFIDENLLTSPGRTLIGFAQALRGAIEENYVKPAQVERAKEWAEQFLDKKEGKDRLFKAVEPHYRQRLSQSGESIYGGNRADVIRNLETIWQAAAGDVAYAASQKIVEEESRKAAEARRRAEVPPNYSTQAGGASSGAKAGTKVTIPALFATQMRRAGITKPKDMYDMWNSVKDTWGKE